MLPSLLQFRMKMHLCNSCFFLQTLGEQCPAKGWYGKRGIVVLSSASAQRCDAPDRMYLLTQFYSRLGELLGGLCKVHSSGMIGHVLIGSKIHESLCCAWALASNAEGGL